MKKILSMILAFALCLSLVGCGSAAAASDGSTSNGDSSAAMIAETAAVQTEEELITAEAEAEEDVETTVTITLSDGASRADGAGVTVSGDTVTITAGGSYRVTGLLTNGQIVVNAPEEKVVLALDGASVTCENSAALYVVKAKKVILSLVSGSENSLASTGEYIQTDDNTVDAAIFSKDDLTIKGSGALTVSSETGHGIVSKDELKIKSGTLTVTAAKKGMAANDLVEITGGDITIASGKHGIHCDEALTVSHGTVNITKSFEGLEAKTIEISGGDIAITASDDGLNATDSASSTEADGWGWGFGGMDEAQEGVYILISGGKLTVNASGDGLDSNGDLTITGGEVYISGPTSDGDGALDYAGTGTITGGTLIAAGSSGMAQSLSSDTQGVMLLTLSGAQSAGLSPGPAHMARAGVGSLPSRDSGDGDRVLRAVHVVAAAALEAGRLDLHHLELVVREPALDLQHLRAGLEGHRVDDDDDIRIDADRPVDDRAEITLAAADEDAVRDRQRTLVGDILPLPRSLEALYREAGRRDAADDADVVDLELIAVLLERVDRVLIHLDGNHLALRTGQCGFDRHTAGAGADIVDDAVLAKGETAEAQRTHIALRHRDPIEAVEAVIRDTEASDGCTETIVLEQRDGEAVEALVPELARGTDGEFLIRVAQALADRDAHVIEAELYQLLRDDGDIVLGTEQGADETVLADQRHHVLMQAVQADELHVRHADRTLAEEVLDARHAGIVPDLELLERALVLGVLVAHLRHVLFQRAPERDRAGIHARIAGEDR